MKYSHSVRLDKRRLLADSGWLQPFGCPPKKAVAGFSCYSARLEQGSLVAARLLLAAATLA